MKAKQEHTATPWEVQVSGQQIHIGPHRIAHINPEGESLRGAPRGADIANAEFIVRAVNAHEELKGVLEKLIDDLAETHTEEKDAEHYGDDPSACTYCNDLDRARKILA